jgi:hypothetical protein
MHDENCIPETCFVGMRLLLSCFTPKRGDDCRGRQFQAHMKGVHSDGENHYVACRYQFICAVHDVRHLGLEWTHINGNTKSRNSCRELFKNWEIITLYSQYIYSLILYMVNNKYLFNNNNEIHAYRTRYNNNLPPNS